jgi:antitoxin (DNA-binding transcriptional repressor) of toxin-antitoxin stability system
MPDLNSLDLSKLLARVEAGEEVEIARDGVPVAMLVRVEPSTPGSQFLNAHGSLAGSITIGEDFELSNAEFDSMLPEPRIRAYDVAVLDPLE